MAQKTHILLVVDDANLRATLRTCLEMAGYLCVEAKSGHDARIWLEEEHLINLIVTDHQMPAVSGLEFVRGVRSQPRTKALPIIFYSGQLTNKLKARGIQVGVNAMSESLFH